MSKRVFLVAGEASGEQLGASLLEASRAAGLDLDFAGVVGPRLRSLGVRKVFDGDVLAVMGFVEVLGKLGRIRALLRDIDRYLAQERPALAVLIDHPAFNLRVAALAKRHGIPVLYYVSPQIWAWRAHRIHKIARLVDHMMVLFPFEAPFYQAVNVPVTVVAHPLLETTARTLERGSALDLKRAGALIAMLPGSRQGEIQRLTPRLAAVARCLRELHGDLDFAVPLARAGQRELFEKLWRRGAPDLPLPHIHVGQTQALLMAADLAVVASGTATLETALLGKPAVVVYAVNPLSYLIAKRLVKIPHVALPNILLERPVYPEFIQENFRPQVVAEAVSAILRDGGEAQRIALRPLRGLLHGASRDGVAQVLRRLLHAPE